MIGLLFFFGRLALIAIWWSRRNAHISQNHQETATHHFQAVFFFFGHYLQFSTVLLTNLIRFWLFDFFVLAICTCVPWRLHSLRHASQFTMNSRLLFNASPGAFPKPTSNIRSTNPYRTADTADHKQLFHWAIALRRLLLFCTENLNLVVVDLSITSECN